MTDTKSITPKVYLEYSHKDKVLGQRIQGILRGKNIPFWEKNRDMTPGDNINDVFYDVLENCTHMIFIWSYWTAGSESMEFLIQEAKEKGLKVIPVVTSSEALPRTINGVRPIRYSSFIDLASGRDNDSGKDVGLLLASPEDAELWPVIVRIYEDRNITLTGIKELTPKEARRIAYPTLGPSKTVDKARENSLRLKYQLSRLLSTISRGDDARAKLDRLNKDMRVTVEHWSTDTMK